MKATIEIVTRDVTVMESNVFDVRSGDIGLVNVQALLSTETGGGWEHLQPAP